MFEVIHYRHYRVCILHNSLTIAFVSFMYGGFTVANHPDIFALMAIVIN